MHPFYFASAERALFGVHHPPRSRGRTPRGAVLCYPFGVEYMRAHRAFRQLTALLTRAGFHVFRFDYFGTGDSAGSGEEGFLDQWREDVASAVFELRAAADLDRVTLVGLRLGAALALQAARKRRDVEHVVVWDPVVSGRAYLDELLPRKPRRKLRVTKRRPVPDTEGIVEVSGFPLSPSLGRGLRSLDLTNGAGAGGSPVDVVVSKEDPDFVRLRDHLARHGRLKGYHLVPSEGDWAQGDAFGSAILPREIVQTVVACVDAGARP